MYLDFYTNLVLFFTTNFAGRCTDGYMVSAKGSFLSQEDYSRRFLFAFCVTKSQEKYR